MNDQFGPNYGDKFNDEPERTLDEAELRDVAEELQRIGPEDMSIHEIEENLEEYGFDQMDEGTFESVVTGLADDPDWMNDNALERSNIEDAIDNEDGMYE